MEPNPYKDSQLLKIDSAPLISRRQALVGILGTATLFTVAACSSHNANPMPTYSPHNSVPTGKTRNFKLIAQNSEIDLGGRIVKTKTYGGKIPGDLIRANVGDRLKIQVNNQLDVDTSIHWHGLALDNKMDGVPGVTMNPIASNSTFDYDFIAPDAGTYWFHPHTGLQLDTGLYAPLIIDDPSEKAFADAEWIVVLDDWTDGLDATPEEVLAALKNSPASNGGMMHDHMAMDGGDVQYSMYLINGRPKNDPEVFNAKPGQRVRIRIINASADSIFNVAIAEHKFTVTHTDGFPASSPEGATLKIGMGERYDILVELKDGVFPLIARPANRDLIARALIKTGSGQVPAEDFLPTELSQPALSVVDIKVAAEVALPSREPDSVRDIALTGTMNPYEWFINGKKYPDTDAFVVQPGELVRFNVTNHSMMSHPLHFHGHTFQFGNAGGSGARKDTLLIPGMASTSLDLLADNKGMWMVHCHNAYHAETGMMTMLNYSH